ncbi:MAG: hypothetical protein Q9174_003865, partial [Haloplaca sp. 1 TL-2023]
MENEALPSSQSTAPISTFASDGDIPSSPTRPSKNDGRKAKARPTVTPKSFARFFTPRTSLSRGNKIGASRRALRDITASAANRKSDTRRRSPKKDRIDIFDDGEGNILPPPSKRRKVLAPVSPALTLDHSSPLKRVSRLGTEFMQDDVLEDASDVDDDHSEEEDDSSQLPIQPIRRSRQRGAIGGFLSKELGLGSRNRRQYPLCTEHDRYFETADFYSTSNDSHVCIHPGNPAENALPFCSASCNTNSLVAIGDEEGGIRLLETDTADESKFHRPHLTFRPHTNAVMDLAFSPDDLLLATASGDQSSKIIDMPSQRAIYVLEAHSASLKQVRFQPGSSSVLATSSRDGSVRLWDLRCKTSDTPLKTLKISLEGAGDNQTSRSLPRDMTYARPVDAILGAHVPRINYQPSSVSRFTELDTPLDLPSKAETPSRRGNYSVTALTFLPQGREHLLLTGSEADATVKLWDLRTTHYHRRSTNPVPLASTQRPQSHTKHRHYAITSMALSGDGARLYTLCHDNTVYAYSTSHLILGSAPELATISSSADSSHRRSRFSRTTEKEGLGPLYGLRHPLFHTSFYVKLAVRPAKHGRTELLAAGSVDGCAVLWPTDERYMRPNVENRNTPHPPSCLLNQQAGYATPPSSASRPTLSRTTSNARLNDTIPIYTH